MKWWARARCGWRFFLGGVDRMWVELNCGRLYGLSFVCRSALQLVVSTGSSGPFVFWNALLTLMNSAGASMPVFLPKSLASW